MGNQLIAPSILSADFSDLKSDIFRSLLKYSIMNTRHK